MGRNNFAGVRYYIQIDAMKRLFPEFRCRQDGRNLIFTGILFIHPNLPRYKVRVVYRENLRPKVFVLSPSLDSRTPHLWPDGSLCLYHPDMFKWNARRLIAKEIMGWTISWIYFYEYWKQSGRWIGPEAPHGDRKAA